MIVQKQQDDDSFGPIRTHYNLSKILFLTPAIGTTQIPFLIPSFIIAIYCISIHFNAQNVG